MLSDVKSVPSLFAAMSIHLAMAGFLDPIGRVDKIAKHRLRVSMTAMKELSAYWPVCTWIFQLFTKIIKERRVTGDNAKSPDQTSKEPTPNAPPFGVDDTFGNWAEIEEFSSTLGMMDGFEFDFSNIFDVGFDGVSGSNLGQESLLPQYVGS
jgi:hypothetical protein